MRLTWLYAPANRPAVVTKAIHPEPGRPLADVVIIDLEDAVRPEDKDSAREGLAELLAGIDPLTEVHVRINAEQPWADKDLAAVAELPISGVRLPKVESADQLDAIAARLPETLELHVLIETARGITNLQEICDHPRATGVSLGEADLRTALRSHDAELMNLLRNQLVIALAAAGKEPPVGSAYLAINDEEGLLADTRRLADSGFRGRTAIHPRQISFLRKAFRPPADQVDRARRIVEAASNTDYSGAVKLDDGTFVDAPVLTAARETLDLAARTEA